MSVKDSDDWFAKYLGLPLPIVLAVVALLFFLVVIKGKQESPDPSVITPHSGAFSGEQNYVPPKSYNNVQLPSLTKPVKNFMWLVFGSFYAIGAAVFLFKGARSTKKRPLFAASLYAASVILCAEVLIVFIRFFTHF